MRGLRLLLSSVTLKEFGSVLKALLTVVLSETDERCDGPGMIETPYKISRQFILEKIRGISFEHISMDDIDINNDSKYSVNDENED